MRKPIPSMDAWLKEAKAHASAPKIGMYLIHNGMVRQSARQRSVTVRKIPSPLPVCSFPMTRKRWTP